MIARDRDTNTGSAGFETREYVLQNWRADVVALAAPDGDLLERVTYDAYGIPFATHPTDLTTGNTGGVAGYGMPSGVLDANDYNYFLTLYSNTDFRADWNRDGVFNTGDSFAYLADYTAATGSWGRGVLSNRSSILGYAGYIHEPATGAAGNGHGSMYHCRLRVHHAGLGRWIQRDPPQFEYGEGMSLYWYTACQPVLMVDPLGGPMCPGGNPSLGWCTGSYISCITNGNATGGPGSSGPGSNEWEPIMDPTRWDSSPCRRSHRFDPCARGSAKWRVVDRECARFCAANPTVNGQVDCDGNEKSRCCICPRNINGHPIIPLIPAVVEALSMCTLTHEELHWYEHPCDMNRDDAECAGYQAHVECLNVARGWCSTLETNKDRLDCEKQFDYEIERMQERVDRYCNGVQSPHDPDEEHE